MHFSKTENKEPEVEFSSLNDGDLFMWEDTISENLHFRDVVCMKVTYKSPGGVQCAGFVYVGDNSTFTGRVFTSYCGGKVIPYVQITPTSIRIKTR